MYTYEIADILFLIKSLRNTTSSFNINYITFFTGSSRLAKSHKLHHSYNSNNIPRHSYFNRICRLWNALPVINLDYPIGVIKKQLKTFLFNHFITNFDPVLFISSVHAQDVNHYPDLPTSITCQLCKS